MKAAPRLLTQQRRAFVDTSAFFSLVNPHDAHHQEARAVMARLSVEQWRTFTSNFVVAEAHALFLTRLGRGTAAALLRQLQSSSITVVRTSLRDEDRATRIVFQYDDKDLSLTDATSFAIMERLHVTYAFTFDANFAQYGLATL